MLGIGRSQAGVEAALEAVPQTPVHAAGPVTSEFSASIHWDLNYVCHFKQLCCFKATVYSKLLYVCGGGEGGILLS